MQRRSSLGCVISLIVLCCASLTASGATSSNVAGLSQWDVTSFQVNLLNHYGANGDVQSDQNGWIHLGANHLEGGDMTYNVQVGRLSPTDIVEVWVDGFSSSNDLNVGPTLFIGAGKNRFEQITRMSGDAWRPFVFRFADDRLYGDVTDPSNRNENWRIRYPSSKYEVRRIDKAPSELLEGATLPVRISITGVDDFILKRLEVVVYRSGGGSSGRGQLAITNLAPYKVYRGNRVTVQFNQALPEKGVDFYVVDPSGRESRIYPQITSSQRDSAWFYADGDSFGRSGDYLVKVVDRSWDQAQSDTERFEYLHPVARNPEPRRTPKPLPTPDACALPPCPPVAYAPAPVMQPAQIMPVVPSVPFTQVPVLAGPPVNEFETAPRAIVPVPKQQTGGGGAYTIQIAAVRSQQAAFSLVNTLRAQGFDAYVSNAMQGQMYRVRVGRYPSRNQAAYDATRLQQSGFETWITN